MGEKEKPHFPDGEKLDVYTIECKLGEGGFGCVYKVKDTKGMYYAMKTENEAAPLRVLKMDVLVLREMKKKEAKHFCRIKDSGNIRGVNYVVMSLVGISLNELRKMQDGRHFTQGCALLSGVQCLEAIEELHSSGFIHRDVKLSNFAIGRNEPRRIFLIDFGMCRRFTDKDNEVRRPRWACGFRGTLPYAPISCHLSRELSRKDDLESWLYAQVEMTNGDLPWRKRNDMDGILKEKLAVRSGKAQERFFVACPPEYRQMLAYIDSVNYYDVPNYQKMLEDMKGIIISKNLHNAVYDWEKDDEKPIVSPCKSKAK